MPPTPPPPPPMPRGDHGTPAREYLEGNGLVAVTPPIRASSVTRAIGDPFLYYLVDRLGIVPILSLSRALSTGSWFHARAEMMPFDTPGAPLPPEDMARLRSRLDDRLVELRQLAAHMGLSADRTASILADEESDFALALALYSVAFLKLQLPGYAPGMTVARYLNGSHFRTVSIENLYTVEVRDPDMGTLTLAAQPDRLLLNTSNNHLWLVDYKTCQESPTTRLQTCTSEQQTLQYMHVISTLLQENPEALDVPRGTALGGMIHIAAQKPSIRLSGNDRDFTISTRTLTRGPRRGQEVTEKEYFGEPKFDNYLNRVKEWLEGVGEYQHEAPLRATDPCVNMSTVHFGAVDRGMWARYHARIRQVARYATCEACPANFPDNPSSLRGQGGTLSPYLPFYTETVEKWPGIVARDFLIRHRDEALLETARDRS